MIIAAPIMKPDLKYRYPGVAPFSTAQREIFFGRESEVQRLTALVASEQQVLLYAKSGLGKSSLINAGLIPKLALQANSVIYRIRFGAYQGPSARSPLETIHAALPPVPETFLDAVIPQEGSLWQHFKALVLSSVHKGDVSGNNATSPPATKDLQAAASAAALAQRAPAIAQPPRMYIIFDQFEELFTYPKESIFDFKKQMADLLYRVVPKHFRAILEIRQASDPNFLDEHALQQLNQGMYLHVLYAIREDKYSSLNRLSDYLPDILHTRFQLGPLNRANAEAAITLPASIKEGFCTQPFYFSTRALNSILTYLTKGQDQAVETTQLQILCSRLEQLCKLEIRKDDIPAFDDIFLEFYYECIQSLPESMHDAAQAFVEEELIRAGQRIALDRLVCLEHLDSESLDKLLRERHLLRAEQNSTGGSSLELSHDTLVAPILRARAVRLARLEALAREEEERRLRKELERSQAARAKSRRQLRNTRMALIGAVIGILVAGIAMLFAVVQMNIADRMALTARQAAQKSQMAEQWALREKANAEFYHNQDQMRIKMQVDQCIERAWAMKRNSEMRFAIEFLYDGLKLDPSRNDIRILISKWTH
jgi:hypothetical protein